MKISLSTSIFKREEESGITFSRAVEMASEAGFSMIEISRRHKISPNGIEALKKTGVDIWAVHGTLGYNAVSLLDGERRDSIGKEIVRMENAACFAPCPYVVHYLHRFNDSSVGDRWEKSIEELHRKAVELNLTLAVETVPHKPKINERYPDSFEIASFVRSFDSDNLKICIDINHSNLNENLEDVIKNCVNQIATCHISDNNGEWEDHLPPGEGIIDIPQTFYLLKKNGYAGPFNIECRMPCTPTVDKLKELREEAKKIFIHLRSI